jgi:hypothetical protein
MEREQNAVEENADDGAEDEKELEDALHAFDSIVKSCKIEVSEERKNMPTESEMMEQEFNDKVMPMREEASKFFLK